MCLGLPICCISFQFVCTSFIILGVFMFGWCLIVLNAILILAYAGALVHLIVYGKGLDYLWLPLFIFMPMFTCMVSWYAYFDLGIQ